MKPRVYVETTIPSLYHDGRQAPETVARRGWTRAWWESAGQKYDLVTSVAVLDEIVGSIAEQNSLRQQLMSTLPLLPVVAEIAEIVQFYIDQKLMPADPVGDALHLAIASYHKCDFLVTWNCRHLANANKFGHFRRLNSILGLFVPALVTPLELLGEIDEHE